MISTFVSSLCLAAALCTPTRDSRLTTVLSARTINYYPAAHAWTNMWLDWEELSLQKDIDDAKRLGTTNMRIIIFPRVFEFPHPLVAYTDRLRSFVELCRQNGMTVSFTLFDWWNAFPERDNSLIWAKAIIEPYRNDPTVINVELQNELPVLEYKAKPEALTWAQFMIDELHLAYPNMPLTFSVNSLANLSALKDTIRDLDYYDYHYYESGALSYALLSDALAIAGDKPMIIGEAGLNTKKYTEGQQAAFFAGLMNAAQQLKIGGIAVWALYDFTDTAIPKGSKVAEAPEQKFYGVYRVDRSPKAAVEVIRKAWAGAVLSSREVLDLGFEHPTDRVNPWTSYRPDLGEAARSSDQGHSGMGSIEFTTTASSNGTFPSLRISPIEIVRPNGVWRVTVWAKGSADANGTTRVRLSWFDKNRTYIPSPAAPSSAVLPRGTTVWTQLSIEETAPADAAFLEIHLQSGNNTQGAVWFDDVEIFAPAFES